MNSPKISIVIPSYNKFKYIGKTLDSIFSQSYKNFEVIIQDGGSNDGTINIIKKYAEKYPNKMAWVSEKDNGQLEAVNKGMKKTSGDVVTFINADDYYDRGAFETVAAYYIENPKSIWFVGKSSVVNSEDREIAKWTTWYKNLLLSLNKYYFLLLTNYIMQPSVFITKKAFEKYGPFTGTANFIMEYDLWLKMARIYMPVVINKRQSFFRIEASTKTKTMFKELLKEDEKIIKKYTQNKFVIFVHNIHNLGRKIIEKWI